MKYGLLLCIQFSLINLNLAQDTFSIVAVDPVTGEVGSAGASCLDNLQFPGSNGAIIISDVIPGRGAIHTQAQWNQANQLKARQQLLAGKSPAEVIAYLSTPFNDSNFNPSIRQYGIADLSPQGQPRASAYTGTNCMDYKNHIIGPNYAIQGNILSGQAILDSMEQRFLEAQGSLADRLMAALQGANVPGADTRCLSNGTSSLSAFIRVAKPNDLPNALYLDLNVPSLPAGREPIDSVQTLFDRWKQLSALKPDAELLEKYSVLPNPNSGQFRVIGAFTAGTQFFIFDSNLKLIHQQKAASGLVDLAGQPTGVYLLKIVTEDKQVIIHKIIIE